MITINPARVRPQSRVETQSDKQPSSQTKSYTAPIGGMVTNANLANQEQQSAVVLENFWPTQTGIRPRGGSQQRITLPTDVKCVFEYRANESRIYFAATDNEVFSFTPETAIDGAVEVISGQQSGEYNVLETQTDGGSFLTIANGLDYLQIYDGANWQQVTDISAPHAITNIDTRNIVHAWAYRNRQFFIQKNSMNAWYLGVNAISGAATRLPLSGVYNKGGKLLFGATWSSDSGDGMDDRCVFVTDQGECAIFSGDPIDGWALIGVYDVGEPLGPRATMSVGGDLVIATKGGLIPITAALQKDPAQLKLDSLSRPIEPDWQREAALAGLSYGWRIVKWESRNAAFVCPPNGGSDGETCYVVNTETGRWTKFTGWRLRDLNILGDALYFSDRFGTVLQGDLGGLDDATPILCRTCFAFDHLSDMGAFKQAHLLRATFKHTTPFTPQLSVASNFRPNFPTRPNAASDAVFANSDWDTAEWDISDWGDDLSDAKIDERWNTVSAHGHALAVQLQIVSGAAYKLDCELISADLTYSSGSVVA